MCALKVAQLGMTRNNDLQIVSNDMQLVSPPVKGCTTFCVIRVSVAVQTTTEGYFVELG